MNIKMTLQQTDPDIGKTVIKDISDIVFNISYENQIVGQPGKLTFDCVDDQTTYFNEGAIIQLVVDDVGVFYGYVFASTVNETEVIGVTAYDQMRYLQNGDIYVISGMTASQVFEMICLDFNIKKYNVVSPSSLIIPARVHDGKSLFDIIDFGIGHELRFNQKWYMMRDNFGVLEFIDVATLKTDYILNSNENIFKYTFESTIDEDTYNQVKIYQENRVNKKGKAVKNGGTVVSRDYGFDRDPNTIATWGTLQYCDKSDKGMNQAQLDMYAHSLLSQKDRPTQKFTLSAEGNLDINAGNQIVIYIGKVQQKINDRVYFLVTACTHSFSNNQHTMDLTLMLPQYGLALR